MNTPDVDTTKALVEQYVTGRVTSEVVAMTWQQVGQVIEARFSDDYQVNEIATDHARAITPQLRREACKAGLDVAREIRGISASLGARPDHLAALDAFITDLEKEQQK